MTFKHDQDSQDVKTTNPAQAAPEKGYTESPTGINHWLGEKNLLQLAA